MTKSEQIALLTVGVILLWPRKRAGIGAIYPNEIGGDRQCLDGKWTDSNGRGSCSYHGGLYPVEGPKQYEYFSKTENKWVDLKNPTKGRIYELKRYKYLIREKGINAIYPNVPELFECNDGTFSTSSGANACARHGGRKSREPLSFGTGGSALLNVQDVPLQQIHIDRRLFQGREKAFSQRSVDNIVNDVQAGRFVWANLDPITLWQSPEGKLYLLSGHSRHHAFEVLHNMGARVDGKGFTRIPAKIYAGDIEAARRLALESNTLSTKETDLERATYYRKLRQDGVPEKSILEQIKKNEGRNWTNVWAYTYLSPSGRAWATVRQFADGEDTSATLAKNLAKWIGNARRQFPMLTNEHETELYDWLFEHKGYGTGSQQVSNEREFLEKVGRFVQKNTEFGVFQQRPLNILSAQQKSPAEQEYDRQIYERQTQITALDKEIRAKIKDLTDRKATKDDLQRIISPMEATLRNLRSDLQRLMLQKSQVIEYSKNEATLFGIRHRRRMKFQY